MIYFCDTEFTDFTNPDLISFAIVGPDGDELYIELSDYERALSSAFVQQHVEPLLLGGEHRLDRTAAKAKVVSWLSERAPCTIVVDYGGDWWLLRELINQPIVGVDGLMLLGLAKTNAELDAFNEGVELYFINNQLPRHNALWDARSMLAGYAKLLQQRQQEQP